MRQLLVRENPQHWWGGQSEFLNLIRQVKLCSFRSHVTPQKIYENKLKEALPEDAMRRVITGTYHSIMSKFIRDKAVEVGLNPNFSIVDESSTITMYRRLVENKTEFDDLFRYWTLSSNDYNDDKKIRQEGIQPHCTNIESHD